MHITSSKSPQVHPRQVSTHQSPQRAHPGRPPARRRRGRVGLAGLLLGAVAFVPALLPGGQHADAAELKFPFMTDFDTAAGGQLSGDAAIDNGMLRLTTADVNKAGAWSTTDTFPSSLGLEVHFRYVMRGGTGADGLLMYLADGRAEQGVGQYGAALGYACRSEHSSGAGPCAKPGLPGGFVGIAFDDHGNFSSPLNESGPGRQPAHVAIRGSGNGNDGYRFLRSAAAPEGLETVPGKVRNVYVTVQPDASETLGISVRMDDAHGKLHSVLDHVPLVGEGQAALPPTLRLGFAGSTGAQTNIHMIDRVRVSLPGDLRVEHDAPENVSPGQHVRYTATVSNVGRNPSDPSPFTLTIPDGLSDARWTCTPLAGATCAQSSGQGSAATTLGLPRGGKAVFTVEGTVKASVGSTLESRATVELAPELGETNATDNESRARMTVVGPAPAAAINTGKAVALVDGAKRLRPGDQVEYTVTVTNSGTAAARDVGATDDLPRELAFVRSTDGCSAHGRAVTCSSDRTLDPGAEHAFRFRARLDPAYAGDGSDVVNIAVGTSPDDPDGGTPSDPVPLPPIDREHPTPTPSPTKDESDGDTTASPDSDDHGGLTASSRQQPRRLAFTGSVGVGAVAIIGTLIALMGLLIRHRSRRRLATSHDSTAGDTGLGAD